MKLPLETHALKKGETLDKICKQRGFASGSGKNLFKAAYNKDLRGKRSDAAKLEAGDKIVLPKISKKSATAAAEAIWRVIYAYSDAQDALRAQRKVIAARKKKIAEDFKKESEELIKSKSFFMQRDSEARGLYSKCLGELKGSLFGDIFGTCKGQYDSATKSASEFLNMTEAYHSELDARTKDKLAKLKDMESRIDAQIAKLEGLIQLLQKLTLQIGKMSQSTF